MLGYKVTRLVYTVKGSKFYRKSPVDMHVRQAYLPNFFLLLVSNVRETDI